MGFFDDATRPGPDEPDPRGRPWDPPAAELPKAGASALLLARTEVVAVAITAVWAFREGFEPLPPPGPLAFVGQWAGFGIPESRAEVDAQLVLDAAEHSVQLWPGSHG